MAVKKRNIHGKRDINLLQRANISDIDQKNQFISVYFQRNLNILQKRDTSPIWNLGHMSSYAYELVPNLTSGYWHKNKQREDINS